MTRRETQIMELREQGTSTAEIAATLGLNPNYVAAVCSMYACTGAGNDWMRSARDGSVALLNALRRYHSDRCGA